MHAHRPLSEMLTEVIGSVLPFGARRGALVPRSIELDLPIEAFVADHDGVTTLVGDVPVWRWRTDFDLLPGRLKVTLKASER